MKFLNRLATAANGVLMAVSALIAAVLLVSGLYVLNDIYYTNRTAFTSYDLLQYRPAPAQNSGEPNYSFSELKDINTDTVGWIELFGTNINYPVMHGRDNLEYLNKDIFGYSTLSGSIYLAAENDGDFSNWYNLIYGHHMDNGAMFGDIEKYLDPDFFASHSEGILQTDSGDFIIQVFACIRTNAYEDAVYQVTDGAESKYPVLQDYIQQHAVTQKEIPDGGSKIIGLSTCSDAVTDGRIVLFASVKPWDNATNGSAAERMAEDTSEDTSPLPQLLTASGHKVSRNKWSFLNLMCVVCTFLTLLPVWALRRKFGQMRYARNMIKKLEDDTDNQEDAPDMDNAPEDADENNANSQIVSDLKHFLRKSRTGLILEAIILIVSVIAFLMTEDITGRMGIRDKWTGLMILIAAAALTADFICLRYRGQRPEEENSPEN